MSTLYHLVTQKYLIYYVVKAVLDVLSNYQIYRCYFNNSDFAFFVFERR